MPSVAIAVHEHTMLFELAIAAEVFGVDRSDLPSGRDGSDLTVCTPDGSPARWLPDVSTRGFEALPDAGTVIVPSASDLDSRPDPALLSALCAAYERGARVVSLCTGAFVLAAAGLLDGRVV